MPDQTWLGAIVERDGTAFLLWAPRAERVEVVFEGERPPLSLVRSSDGYHRGFAAHLHAGARYAYRLDGGDPRPDPASRSQPDGVHGFSEVVDLNYPWTDAAWRGLPLSEHVIYELHVGTFSERGDFAGVEAELERLRSIGITAIELMPLAAFPGRRNWGYDGVLPSAVHAAYGGPAGLARLIDAAHRVGLAVLIDVVYNHLGPEGNYLGEFGPYFTEAYHTPWGAAINFDQADSDEVRRYFLESALGFMEFFHADGLRLDAVHAICDRSAYPFLEELADRTRALSARIGRELVLIAESDLNDPRMVDPAARGGHGLDAMWSDDFHHALHALLTGERDGYYEDFGSVALLARAIEQGAIYTGEYSSHRRRRHGRALSHLAPEQFVVCAQNHDQVGNRMLGERLSTLVDQASQRLAIALVGLAPQTPLVFMGEEYGEQRPFPYFVEHGDPALVEAVRAGRKREFVHFQRSGEPPDPQAEATFRSALLARPAEANGTSRFFEAVYALRRELQAAGAFSVRLEGEHGIVLERGRFRVVANFARELREQVLPAEQRFSLRLDSAGRRFGGDRSLPEAAGAISGTISVPPRSLVVLEQSN